MIRSQELQELIGSVDSARLETSIRSRLDLFEQRLADLVLSYEIEELNPFMEAGKKAIVLANIRKELNVASWARDEISGRLTGAADALHGTNRKMRRANGTQPELELVEEQA